MNFDPGPGTTATQSSFARRLTDAARQLLEPVMDALRRGAPTAAAAVIFPAVLPSPRVRQRRPRRRAAPLRRPRPP